MAQHKFNESIIVCKFVNLTKQQKENLNDELVAHSRTVIQHAYILVYTYYTYVHMLWAISIRVVVCQIRHQHFVATESLGPHSTLKRSASLAVKRRHQFGHTVNNEQRLLQTANK